MTSQIDLIDADYRQWRDRFRRVIWLRGLCWVLATVIVAALVAGWIDFWVRPRNAAWRWAISGAVVAFVAIAAWRVLVGPLVTFVDPARLARLLDQLGRHSSGERSLAAQTKSSGQTSPLLAAVADVALDDVRSRPSHLSLRSDACLWPMFWFGLALIAAAATVSLGSQESWTAFRRLTVPWKEFAWPQQDWLVLIDPQFVAVPEQSVIDADQPLRWYVVDERGSPPSEMTLQVRRGEFVETRKLVLEDVRRGSVRVTRAGLIELTGDEPFSLRVIGGDDRRMPWLHVNVYHAPRVTEFQIATTPPAYTGIGRQESESLSGHVECLVGAHIEVTAVFDQPLQQASLVREAFPIEELELHNDGYQVTASWTVTTPGRSKYQFEVVGTMLDRTSTTRPCEVLAVSDTAPSIEVESPPDSMLVTESADVPLRFSAEDDLAIDQVTAAYSLTMSADAESSALMTETERITDQLLVGASRLQPELLGAMVGDRISVWAEATDRFDLGPPHITRSSVRTLSVVTEADKLSELNARLESLVAELSRLDAIAVQSANTLSELQIQVETTGELPQSDVEIVRKLHFETQTAARDVYESDESLLAEVTGLLNEIDWNGLDATELGTHLDTVAVGLTQLRDWQFPSLLSDLTLVLSRHQPSSVAIDPDVQGAIVNACHAQRDVTDLLSSLLSMLGEFRRFGNLGESLTKLRIDQESINQDTLRTAESTLGREWDELSPQQQADLRRLAERQSQVASSLSGLVTETQRQTAETPSASAQTITEIQHRLSSPELTAWLSESAGALTRNELGLAMPTQQSILTELTAIAGIVAGRATPSETSPEATQQSLATLNGVLEGERTLLVELQQAGDDVSTQQQSEWATRQMELLTIMEQMLDSEPRMMRQPWMQAGRRAMQRMRAAHLAIVQGDLMTALTEEQEAVDDLSQSVTQLDALLADQHQALALEEMQELIESLKSLIDAQSQLIAETRELDAVYASVGQWNRELLRRLREAAGRQQALAEEAASVVTSSSAWPAIQFALDEAMLLMHQAATQLDARAADLETQQLQEQIVDRLQQVLDSLHHPVATGSQQNGDDPLTELPQTADAGARLSQVRLLRESQEQLRLRTEAAVPSAETSDAEMTLLTNRQRDLADLAEPLLTEFTQPTAGGEENDAVHQAAEDALAGVEAAAERLAEGQFTLETVAIQAGVVAALDVILEQVPSSGTSNLAGGEQSPAENPSQQPGIEDDGQTFDTTSGGDGTGGNDVSSGSPVEIEVQRARDRELANEVWGHLPPRAQQQLQADFSAEFLPEYDDWIRRYYEALAEER